MDAWTKTDKRGPTNPNAAKKANILKHARTHMGRATPIPRNPGKLAVRAHEAPTHLPAAENDNNATCR